MAVSAKRIDNQGGNGAVYIYTYMMSVDAQEAVGDHR